MLAVGPFAFMEVYNNPEIRSGEFAIPYALFHAMWLFPTMLFLAATPIVRGLRAGERVMAHPIALVLRSGFLTLAAAGWLFMLWDQMPCFLAGKHSHLVTAGNVVDVIARLLQQKAPSAPHGRLSV
jgi:hypothetical protein